MAYPSINPDINKQLFLDDDAIERLDGLEKRLHRPVKQGPVLEADSDRGQIGVRAWTPPVWNPEKSIWEWWHWGDYRVAPHGPYQNTSKTLICYAVSSDGVRWETPSLELYEWEGSRDNNIACDPADPRMEMYHMVRDEADPDPARRYKALFGAHGRAPAVSPDGFGWTFLDVAPIPSQDQSNLLHDHTTGQFIATVKHRTEWGRSVWISSSTNFETWTDPRLIFHADKKDQENRRRRIRSIVQDPSLLSPPLVDEVDRIAEVYQMAVMPYEGMYVGFPVLFNPAAAIPPPHRNYTAVNQIELAVSRDLLSWKRVADRTVFIGIDPWDGKNYGTTQVLPCGPPQVHDGREIRIYYNGFRFRGPDYLYDDSYAPYFARRSAVCMATLRLDGFVSLNPTDGEGTLLTKPFRLTSNTLKVNANASRGFISAELLDAATGRVVPGYGRTECIPVSEDSVDATLGWKGNPGRDGETIVRARISIAGAELYSFRLAE